MIARGEVAEPLGVVDADRLTRAVYGHAVTVGIEVRAAGGGGHVQGAGRGRRHGRRDPVRLDVAGGQRAVPAEPCRTVAPEDLEAEGISAAARLPIVARDHTEPLLLVGVRDHEYAA